MLNLEVGNFFVKQANRAVYISPNIMIKVKVPFGEATIVSPYVGNAIILPGSFHAPPERYIHAPKAEIASGKNEHSNRIILIEGLEQIAETAVNRGLGRENHAYGETNRESMLIFKFSGHNPGFLEAIGYDKYGQNPIQKEPKPEHYKKRTKG